jgi:hypothetical protein
MFKKKYRTPKKRPSEVALSKVSEYRITTRRPSEVALSTVSEYWTPKMRPSEVALSSAHLSLTRPVGDVKMTNSW